MPARLAVSSFFYGSAFGLLKIVWIVIAAVFLYDISVETGQFEIMKQSVAAITPDRRLQLLLVAFCFGAFIEGCAGFGAPVAIAGAFMIGLGFKPFQAAALNSSPTRRQSPGEPSGLPCMHCQRDGAAGKRSERDDRPHSSHHRVIVPFWLVRAMVSWSETFEVLPAILVVGAPSRPRNGSGRITWTATLWTSRPSRIPGSHDGFPPRVAAETNLRFEDERVEDAAKVQRNEVAKHYTAGQTAKAWLPFAILSVLVLLWDCQA